MVAPPPDPDRRLSRRQALQLMDTAYLAAATALLWVGLYYLPVGGALFRPVSYTHLTLPTKA